MLHQSEADSKQVVARGPSFAELGPIFRRRKNGQFYSTMKCAERRAGSGKLRILARRSLP